MGIQDRDYWKEKYDELHGRKKPTGRSKPYPYRPRFKLPKWLVALLILFAIAAATMVVLRMIR